MLALVDILLRSHSGRERASHAIVHKAFAIGRQNDQTQIGEARCGGEGVTCSIDAGCSRGRAICRRTGGYLNDARHTYGEFR